MAKKSGLGKGLTSLISEASVETGINESINEIDINLITPNPDQPRTYFDEESLNELVDSVSKVGILQPLLLRSKGAGYEIIAGERRYQAALRAGLKQVPAQVRAVTEQEVIELALIENLQRSDLNPIEEARGYKKLIEHASLTQEALAQAVSKSRSAVANALRLLDLPHEVQELLFENKLTAGHARAILAVPDDQLRVKLAHKVVDDRLSVRETEKLAPLFSVSKDDKPQRTPSPRSYKIAARQLRQHLETNVRVKTVKGKNKIEIDFVDENDLIRILNIIESGAE